MTSPEVLSANDSLIQILEEMNRTGEFLVSMITDQNGLPIVSASQEGFDPERQSATIAMVKKTIAQNEERLGISETREINIVDSEGHLLFCRSFSAKEHELTLAVLMTNRLQSYRRITGHAINEISRIWNKRWK
jgi:predicted regulator of Ras-like GTPase activity (Roadblock/LC7/MglB family)